MSRIMVMPGTKWQVHLVKRIKELGHTVLLVDPNQDAPCVKLSDEYLQSDIFDIEKIEAYLKTKPVQAIMSDECDIAMPIIAKLSEKFGLNTVGSEYARLYTDKSCMREFCKQHNLNPIPFKLCHSKIETYNFFKENASKRIVIKPTDCNASKGVFIIDSVDDIDRHFDETLSFSKHNKGIIAEKYIDGTEFTVDGIKTKLGHYTLAISEKKHFEHNPSIANELIFTYSNEKYDYESLKCLNDSFVMESGLPFGLTHAEYKYEDGKFFLIEIAARGGGNMISSVIASYLSGANTYDYIIDCALGNVREEKFEIPIDFRNRSAILKFFSTPNGGGTVESIDGIDYLENEEDVVAYAFNFKLGDHIQECISDSARIGFYIACCANRERLLKVMDSVEKNVRINLTK